MSGSILEGSYPGALQLSIALCRLTSHCTIITHTVTALTKLPGSPMLKYTLLYGYVRLHFKNNIDILG